MKLRLFPIFFLTLTACSNTPLDEQPGFEGFPLRAATLSESKRLKECHKAIQEAEAKVKAKTGNYTSRVSSLGVEDACNSLSVKVEAHKKGYLAVTKINEEDSKTTVRWLSDETGKIFEELDDSLEGNSNNGEVDEDGFGDF